MITYRKPSLILFVLFTKIAYGDPLSLNVVMAGNNHVEFTITNNTNRAIHWSYNRYQGFAFALSDGRDKMVPVPTPTGFMGYPITDLAPGGQQKLDISFTDEQKNWTFYGCPLTVGGSQRLDIRWGDAQGGGESLLVENLLIRTSERGIVDISSTDSTKTKYFPASRDIRTDRAFAPQIVEEEAAAAVLVSEDKIKPAQTHAFPSDSGTGNINSTDARAINEGQTSNSMQCKIISFFVIFMFISVYIIRRINHNSTSA